MSLRTVQECHIPIDPFDRISGEDRSQSIWLHPATYTLHSTICKAPPGDSIAILDHGVMTA